MEGSTSRTRMSVGLLIGLGLYRKGREIVQLRGSRTHNRRRLPRRFDRTARMSEPEGTKGKWMALLAAFLGWMFDGLEIGLFPLAGKPAMQELLHAAGPDADQLIGRWMGGIVASFLVGAALGGT